MKIFICAIVIVLLILFNMIILKVPTYAEEIDEEPEYIPMEATAYCYGTKRCDGESVRIGICAAKKEWYGKIAVVYEDDNGELGNFIGFYECLDTGGEAIKEGKTIDIYNPSYDWCMKFGRKKVLVLLIDGKG